MQNFKRLFYLINFAKQAALDFRASLVFDPANLELLKLLRSAEKKYLEVEGNPLLAESGPDQNDIAFLNVGECVQLELPIVLKEGHFFASGVLTEFEDRRKMETDLIVDNIDTSFVRIPITFDSESDSEVDEVEINDDFEIKGFHRIVVEEDDEEKENISVDVKEPGFDKSSTDQNDLSMNTPFEDKRYNHNQYSVVQTALDHKEAGNLFLEAGRPEEALRAYSSSLECDPNFLPALNNRAQVYLILKVCLLMTLFVSR